MSMMLDGQLVAQPVFSPAAERNKQDIRAQLQRILPASGSALEIASGTGQHVVCFAAALPGWTWQPTDAARDALRTIAANTQGAGLRNVRAPLQVDVLSPAWLQASGPPPGDGLGRALFNAIYCANLLHIAPWATCAALMHGAATRLAPAGQLIIYGPYLEDDVPTSDGNQAFDHSLRSSNPAWGLRRREDVQACAQQAGLVLQARHAMPANNLLMVFGRAAT